MWRIANPELQPATLDFTSSGQGWREVTQLFADGVLIINALDLVDWDGEDVQFLICEQCGYEHCKRGDWVSVRRSDRDLIDYGWRETVGDAIKRRRWTVSEVNTICE